MAYIQEEIVQIEPGGNLSEQVAPPCHSERERRMTI